MTFFPDDPWNVMQALIGAILGYAGVIGAVRIVGLRSFAKLASHDFAVTVAIGSVLASSAMASNTPLAIPLFAVAALFGLQFATSKITSIYKPLSDLVQNDPLLLMKGETILHDNLRAAQLSESELRGKLREANVTRLEQVLAVVFEPTGDVSVLHAEPGQSLDDYLLEGVRRSS